MKYLISVLFLLITLTSISQEGLVKRVYYNCVVESPTINGNHKVKTVFVFNPNNLNTILHIRSDGKRVLYVRISDVGESSFDGVDYLFFWALDEKDERILVQIFVDKNMGVSIFADIDKEGEHKAFHYFNKKEDLYE